MLKKGVLRTLLVAGELLYVVDYQHVYHLVEVDEIVHLLVQKADVYCAWNLFMET